MAEAKRLVDLINEFTRQDGVSEKLRSYQVVGEWENIVGALIGKNTELARVENGTLYVKVKSGPWRNELIFMKPRILEKIRHTYPDSGIADIFFI